MTRSRCSRSSRSLAATAALLCALAARPAQASPLFELLGGVGDQGGLTGRVTASGASAAYFNPALLPKARAGFQTSAFVLNNAIDITLSSRGAVDVPIEYRTATNGDGTPFAQLSLPTSWLNDGCNPPECTLPLAPRPRQSAASTGQVHAYQGLGLVAPLLGDKLVLGIYGIVPLSKFTTANSFFVDEREQFFSNSLHAELYSDRLTAPSFAFALGSQLTRRFSVGVSLTLGLRTSAIASTFVGNADDLDRTLILSTDVGVETALAPHLGLNYDISDDVHLTATAHSVQRFDIQTGLSALLPNGSKQPASRTSVHDYLPWQLGLGASWDLISPDAPTGAAHSLSLAASLTLGLWSNYIDRQGDKPSGPYAWKNTPTIGIGGRHGYGQTQTFIDVLYVPSPVPMQSGRTNYVDNDRLSTSAGVDYSFKLLGASWRAGVQGQFHFLIERDHTKFDPTSASGTQLVVDEFPDDAVNTRGQAIPEAAGLQTNNPGFPGFSSGGWLAGGGLTLALLFE